MDPADSRLILPDPPPSLKAHSTRLIARLADLAGADGTLSFADYMETVLYEPGLGYYSAGLHKLGASGDFITAPELGCLFAGCLANQAAEVAARLGDDWELLEIGAGTGKLAADLLLALEALGGPQPRRYRILERSADLRAVQAQTLAERAPALASRVSWLDQPPVGAWRGMLIANEVIDALAVERFRIAGDGSGVRQIRVAVAPHGLGWAERPAPPALEQAVRAVEADLPEPLPAGYHSELCLNLRPWIDNITRALEQGLALFIDYGYPRREYYRPERREGTLVCQYRHRAHFDPFVFPGLQDISAFVDFTALAEAADAAQLEVAGYTSQAMFLIGCGLETLAGALPELAPAQRQALAHELRELTLPGAMGEKFQCMGLTRGLDHDAEPPLRGFALLDLRSRL
jgi:SAM-dependent MidA family methyltransferase